MGFISKFFIMYLANSFLLYSIKLGNSSFFGGGGLDSHPFRDFLHIKAISEERQRVNLK